MRGVYINSSIQRRMKTTWTTIAFYNMQMMISRCFDPKKWHEPTWKSSRHMIHLKMNQPNMCLPTLVFTRALHPRWWDEFTKTPHLQSLHRVLWSERTGSCYKWTGWVWEITGWSSRLQEGKLPIFSINYPNLIKENRRLWTCNRLDLQTLGSQQVMPKSLPEHW